MTLPPRRRTCISDRISRGWFDDGLRTDQNVEIDMVEVFELDRPGSGTQGHSEPDTARLMAIIRTVVDVIGAE